LISISKQGRERYCKVEPESLIPAFMWIDQYHKLWEDRIDSFENYVNHSNKKKNGKSKK